VEREAFVERLRARRAPEAPAPAAPPAPAAQVTPAAAHPARTRAECTALFVERLGELGVAVEVVASLVQAQRGLERLVAKRGWSAVACAPGLRWEGMAALWTVEARDASFGLCEADWAVAETGAVVVNSSAEVRRGYSLVPPAVGFFVPASRLLATVGDVLRELPGEGLALPSCVSFVSGPSSTSDLAAIHVVGVHGPGEVFVWVIAEE
jgi:L-lactate utilization protein LutC